MSAPPPPPPSDEWLPYARRDWARVLLLVREYDPDGGGIFLQQAVEKYLKGWLLDRGWPLRKTHDLELLLDAAQQHDQTLAAFRGLCRRVSGYYLLERYPMPGPSGLDAVQLTADIAEARVLIAALFPNEALPT